MDNPAKLTEQLYRKRTFLPFAVVVIAGSQEVKETEALHGINGVAVCDRAQRQLLFGPEVRTESEIEDITLVTEQSLQEFITMEANPSHWLPNFKSPKIFMHRNYVN